MKKLLSFIALLAFTVIAFAQTTSTSSSVKTVLPSQDTLVATTTITTSIKYDTLKYIAPVLTFTMPGGKASNAVTYSNLSGTASNPIVISGLSFDSKGDSITQIQLFNCKYVHVTLCRFANTRAFAVTTYKCDHITVDYSFITNVGSGVMFQQSTSCKADNNQFLDINGNAAWVGHAILFNQCPASGGQSMSFNKIVNTVNAKNPHDMLNPYKTFGLPGDSLRIIGNIIVGGQTHYRYSTDNASTDGAAGIILGDATGAYQVGRFNILYNPAGVGFQTVGSGTGLKFDHNIIYINIPLTTYNIMHTRLGISDQDSQLGNYIGYNRVFCYDQYGKTAMYGDGEPAYYNTVSTSIIQGWSTNKFQDASLLTYQFPTAAIITYK